MGFIDSPERIFLFSRVAVGAVRRLLVRLHGISTFGVLSRTGTTPSAHVDMGLEGRLGRAVALFVGCVLL